MATRPNPTQNPAVDAGMLRRSIKLMLTEDYILDTREWDELLDFSNQSARLNVMRKNLIASRRNGGQTPRMLSDQERQACALYLMGEGPLPPFAQLVSTGLNYSGQTLRTPAERGVLVPAPGPVEDPNEPGRYVQATGDFAIPGFPL